MNTEFLFDTEVNITLNNLLAIYAININNVPTEKLNDYIEVVGTNGTKYNGDCDVGDCKVVKFSTVNDKLFVEIETKF